MYIIYFLISESKDKAYIGFTGDIDQRIKAHFSGKIKTTKNFGNFEQFILERVSNIKEAIERERYWKSCAGRKKIKNMALSSNGQDSGFSSRESGFDSP